MSITIDWINKLILSDASITDIVAFKDTIRDLEDDYDGILHDPVITYKRLDLGGGAYFHGVDVINGYQLKFPTAGSYTVVGNIGAPIVPVAGVFVDRIKSAAFATVSSGSAGLTVESIVAGVEGSTVLAKEDTVLTRASTDDLTIVNNGVKNASLLIPHTTSLT